MKKGIILICLIAAFLFTGVSYAEDEEKTVIGEIIELVTKENLIQVGNRNYVVEMVLIDDGTEEPVLGSIWDLKVGNLVKVYVIDKGPDFWRTEKVVLFLGSKKEEMLKELD